MLKVLNYFFVTLGVIFFLLLLAGAYFYVTDPYNLKPLLFPEEREVTSPDTGDMTETDTTATPAPTTPATTDRNPALNEEQEAALETFGIDPASLPSEITPEQEACFVNILGQSRVDEIKAGDSPTTIEFFRARSCIE